MDQVDEVSHPSQRTEESPAQEIINPPAVACNVTNLFRVLLSSENDVDVRFIKLALASNDNLLGLP